MSEAKIKKILIATDGSEHAMEAVRYAGLSFNPKTTEIVLFHALKKIDDAFWNMGIKSGVSERMINIKAWEAAQDESTKKMMKESRRFFIEKGFDETRITEKIHPCKQGVARDIIEETRAGYDAILLGRKGLSRLKDLVIGGTAQKLIERTAHIHACVVGKGAQPGKLLIAMDSSEGAMKAVDYVGAMFGDMDTEVMLMHVLGHIAGFETGYGMSYPEAIIIEPEKWLEVGRSEMNRVFEAARDRLVAAGFDAEKISWKMKEDIGSRASAAVEMAQDENIGSIVVGRRGIGKVEEFFIGSMSNKVVQLGKKVAVWVVR